VSDVELPEEIDKQVEEGKDKDLLRKVALGEDFERFIRSHLGRHLITRGETERTDLLESLAKLDPRTHELQMRAAQQRIAVIDSWQQWCAEAVNDGIVAEREFIARNE
jgi:hypothetical protein